MAKFRGHYLNYSPSQPKTYTLSFSTSLTHPPLSIPIWQPTANRQICLSAKKLINNEFIIEFPFSLS
jgi:hypothetical protein